MDIRLAEAIIFLGFFFVIFLIFNRIEGLWLSFQQRFILFANRRFAPYFLLVGLSLLLYFTLFLIYQPYPTVHDEFGYLLGADTLLHGRLSNPTHPMWTFFETHHIFHVPSYSQKYPIGQSIFLALGQAVFGKAVVGVWLCMALANGAIFWMLGGYVPRSWALAGALGVTVYEKFVMHWGMTFWGGGVAMLGGALFFGALVRVMSRPNYRDASLLAVGVVMLANSRPFEGLVAMLPAAGWLLFWFFNNYKSLIIRFLLPFGMVLGLGIAGMMFHNYRVVGNPFKMYYNAYNPQYEEARPLLILSPNPPPVYRHKSMKDWHDVELALYRERRSISGFAYTAFYEKPLYYAKFYLNFVFVLPFLLFVFKKRKTAWDKFVLFTILFGIILTSLNPWSQGHYFAPFLGLIALAVLQGFRQLQETVRSDLRYRPLLSKVYLLATTLTLFTHIAMAGVISYRQNKQKGGLYFKQVHEQTLTQQGDKHLILVRYSPQHSCYYEWVFNGADLQNAPVLWAHDMGDAENQRLLDYYQNRKIWRLEPDTSAEKLIPLR